MRRLQREQRRRAQRDLRVGFGHGAARGASDDLGQFIFTLRKAMLFGAVVGAVLAIAELRQLDEVASGTELGSGADNGFLEPPIAPPPLFPSPVAARLAFFSVSHGRRPHALRAQNYTPGTARDARAAMRAAVEPVVP